MSSSLTNPLSEPLPAYLVKINSTAFHPKKCNLMQRTKLEVIPKYWRQLQMDQKRISPSCEDRLSELTTNQIDRIIDMEKIQSSLQAKKKKEEEVFFTFKPKNQNSHPNTYQACFLAKINQIAIKRNIRHESADLGIYVGSAD